MYSAVSGKTSVQLLVWGLATAGAGALVLGSQPVLAVGAVIALGGTAKLAVERFGGSARVQRGLNAGTILIVGGYVLQHGIRAGGFVFTFVGAMLAAMGLALFLPAHSRLVGSAIGTFTFGVLAVRYALVGDWVIVVAFLLFVLLFGQMCLRMWNAREGSSAV